MTGPFKVFVGAGLATGDVEPSDFGTRDQVGYGELGGVYFLGHHLSVNLSGEFSVVYGEDRTGDTAPASSLAPPKRIFAGGPRLRTGLAVYLF